MNSKDLVMHMNLDLQKSTVDAINSYCRVLELRMRAIAEGANPAGGGPMAAVSKLAMDNLLRELELLSSLRGDLHVMGHEKGYPEER
jgi:hypothetical protein